MIFLKQITRLALSIGFFSAFFIPTVQAQSALDDIKSHLESEGITVIDYSSPEGMWGTLPQSIINLLKKGGYSSLQTLSSEFEESFEQLIEFRRQQSMLEAEKSRLTNTEAINLIDEEIKIAAEDIQLLEEEIKDLIKSQFSELSGEGVNIVFAEIDFYFNYNKWGRLPSRIISVLETEYESLENLIETVGDLNDIDVESYANINDLLRAVTIENIQAELEGIEELSQSDVDYITDSLQILYASGERQIGEVARAVSNVIKNLVIGLAVIWIVYAGARLLFAQGDESVITEQKRSLLYAGVGLVAILLVDRGIDFLYGPAGVVRTELVQDAGFSNEIYGLVRYLKALIGTIAILFIVVSGVRMVFAFGDESTITKQRMSLLWIGVGLILIAIDQIIIRHIFIIPTQQSDQISSSNVSALINLLGTVLQFILGFVGLIAFGILIYGAATMIANYGNDEMVEKSKKIIKNAIIGILVILSAYVIVATLVVFK